MCKAFEEIMQEGVLKKALDDVRKLMINTNWSLEKAMDMLDIPEVERQYILENIDK